MVELGELQGETAKKMGEGSEPSSELGQGRAVKQRILPAHLQSPRSPSKISLPENPAEFSFS